jgi:MFS family permease
MPETPGEEPFSRAYRAKLLGLLFLVALFNFADRNMFAILAQPIKKDLLLSDTQLGLLGGLAFGVVYAITGLPIARIADRRSRVAIIAIATAVWSFFSATCGLAHAFWQLALSRAGVGVGEAAFLPASTSLLGDHYPRSRRASALSIVQLGSPVSTIVGATIAAWVAQQYGWRAAFLTIGLPGMVVALAVWLFLREPERGRYDPVPVATDAVPSWGRTIVGLISKPAFLCVAMGGAMAMFGINAIATFYMAYFVRIHHWTLSQAGFAFGIIQCSSATIGILLGGFGADLLAKRDERWRCWLPAIALTLSTAAYIAAFLQTQPLAAAALILIGGLTLFIYFVPTLGMIQSMAPPNARATAIAIQSFGSTLIGGGLGPLTAGFISDMFASRHFPFGAFKAMCPGGEPIAGASAAVGDACRAASAMGLRWALVFTPLAILVAVGFYLLGARTLRRDMVAAPL